jgi:hypothetical protein
MTPPMEPEHAFSDSCHFTCPVRFGRRRADHIGHLALETERLQFRGAIDLNVAWADIASVRHDDRDILVTLRDSPRVLRFSCHSDVEAERGAAIAQRLAESARGDGTEQSAEYHAPA